MNLISHTLQSEQPVDASIDQAIRNDRAALRAFELGEFLLNHQGLNGFWTARIIGHQAENYHYQNTLEYWLFNACPIVLATRERFRCFQGLLQNLLRSGLHLASLPCGVMDDLLILDYQGLSDIHLTGLDLDPEALQHAKHNAGQRAVSWPLHLECQDAFALNQQAVWDVVCSNGLNIYIEDDGLCEAFYQKLADALVPGGHLLISFITPLTEWQPHKPQDLAYQQYLFGKVLTIRWQCFRTELLTRAQLQQAGLEVLAVQYDSQRMFPTVLAYKPQASKQAVS